MTQDLKIVIVDYDAGNLRNVQKAFEHLGYRSSIAGRPEDVDEAEVVVLPGVGSFADGMERLEERGLDLAIRRAAIEERKPVLGICLGMQLLAYRGDEGGPRPGLEVLPMTVRRMDADRHGLRLPHIGWNEVRPRERSVLFEGLAAGPDFYFVHS
jgi:glutamine amidotransferase